MDEKRCYYCGSKQPWEERTVEYLYSRQGTYLLVPDMPAKVCPNCGMIYYPAASLRAVEGLFFAIQNGSAVADCHVDLPIANYALANGY